MGWDLSSITSDTVKAGIEGIGNAAKSIRAAITGKEIISAEQQTELLQQVHTIEQSVQNLETIAAQGQIDLNKLDAQAGFFRSGWRPSIGWVCAFGLGYSFIIRPLLFWVVDTVSKFTGTLVVLSPMPSLDMKELLALTFCLLGFGGFRMYERIKGKV